MSSIRALLVLVCTSVVLAAASAPHAVAEEQEVVLSVDPAGAADGAPGSDAFQTLGAALEAAVGHLNGGHPVRVLLGPSVYREAFDFRERLDAVGLATPLSIEGQGERGGVVISGADLIAADAFEEVSPGLFAADWPHDLGNWAYPWEAPEVIGHRSEIVRGPAGWPLRQVLLERYDYADPGDVWASEGQGWTYTGFDEPADTLLPETFGVAERDENGNKLYVRPADPEAFFAEGVEAAVRRDGLLLGDKKGFSVRNVTFEMFASTSKGYSIEQPLRLGDDASDIEIVACDFRWNNQAGFSARGSGLTVRDSTFEYNGFSGVNGRCVDSEWTNNSTSFNNWRGVWGGTDGWFLAGAKFHQTRNQLIEDHVSVGNLGDSLWWDIHCKNVVVRDTLSVLNRRSGLSVELSAGPFLLERCLTAFNGSEEIRSSIVTDLTIRDCIAYGTKDWTWEGNGYQGDDAVFHAQFYDRDDFHANLEAVTTGPTVVEGSVIAASGARSELLIRELNGIQRDDPRSSQMTWSGSNNLYWHPDRKPRVEVLGVTWSWASFDLIDNASGLPESGSRVADPRFTDPDNLDFTLLPDSPLLDRRDELPSLRVPEELKAEAEAFRVWATQGKEEQPLATPVDVPDE